MKWSAYCVRDCDEYTCARCDRRILGGETALCLDLATADDPHRLGDDQFCEACVATIDPAPWRREVTIESTEARTLLDEMNQAFRSEVARRVEAAAHGAYLDPGRVVAVEAPWSVPTPPDEDAD